MFSRKLRWEDELRIRNLEREIEELKIRLEFSRKIITQMGVLDHKTAIELLADHLGLEFRNDGFVLKPKEGVRESTPIEKEK